MLHEFAVEPALLGDWHNFHYLHEKFGVPRARLISEFPKKWRRMVYDAAGNFSERQRKILEVWLTDKASFLVPSEREYSWPDDWLKSAETAHAEKSFHAIIACENPRKHPRVLPAAEASAEHVLFKCPCEVFMPKTVESFCNVAGPLLRISSQIVLVDPFFFSKDYKKWIASFAALLSCVAPSAQVQICTSASPNTEPVENRKSELQRCLPTAIPKGFSVEVILLHKHAGQDTHNRFILTDRGGIKFPWGLDTHELNACDIVNLMEKETHAEKFEEFTTLMHHNVACCFSVAGKNESIEMLS